LFDVLMSDPYTVDRLLHSPVIAVEAVCADNRRQVMNVRDVINRGQSTTPIQHTNSTSSMSIDGNGSDASNGCSFSRLIAAPTRTDAVALGVSPMASRI
jgi:hypothetical protein